MFLAYPSGVLKISNTTFVDVLPGGKYYVELSDGDLTVSGSTFFSTSLFVSR